MKSLFRGAAAVGVGLALWAALAAAQQRPLSVSAAPHYTPVTAERLKKPEDGNWLMIRRTYDGWGYSPLDQITRENVKQLQPVWGFATGLTSGHEAPPIVNNGFMFVSTPNNQVIGCRQDRVQAWQSLYRHDWRRLLHCAGRRSHR